MSKHIKKPISIESLPKTENLSQVLKPTTKTLNYLKEDCLSLKNLNLRKCATRDVVPPHTPNSEYEFQESFNSIPKFPNVDQLDIPYIREKGVKYCIHHFGRFFSCFDYTKNYLQFWFLDIITECVWSLQDEYLLPLHSQKVVLKWFLFFVDLLRNQKLNLSRKNFFSVFKEAILIAAEVVDEGCVEVPSPEKLFQLIEDKEPSVIEPSADFTSSTSSIVVNHNDRESTTYFEIEKENEVCRFELPPEPCRCDKYNLSTIYSLTESDTKSGDGDYSLHGNQEEDIGDDMSLIYEADLDIPSRFLEEVYENTEEEHDMETDERFGKNESFASQKCKEDFEIYELKGQYKIETDSSLSSEISVNELSSRETVNIKESKREETNSKQTKKPSDQDILKALAIQKMWEQRLLDMSDPRIGWVPTASDTEVDLQDEEIENDRESNAEEDNNNDWVDMIIENSCQATSQFEDNVVLNFGVLWAIIEIIFKYFYESFQFTLIKMAFYATPEIISQKLNTEWHTMKVNKVVVNKPKYEPKPPPQSLPLEKHPEVEKKLASSHTEKVSVKSVNTPEKSKLTVQEQKALLAMQRQEELRLKEELKIIEENKKYLFPLMQGVTDDFFREIFPGWTKENVKKQSKK